MLESLPGRASPNSGQAIRGRRVYQKWDPCYSLLAGETVDIRVRTHTQVLMHGLRLFWEETIGYMGFWRPAGDVHPTP